MMIKKNILGILLLFSVVPLLSFVRSAIKKRKPFREMRYKEIETQERERVKREKKIADAENELATVLTLFLGEAYFAGKSKNDFSHRATKSLSFTESAGLYVFSVKENSTIKEKQVALERLYILCPDARLGEFILWNLAYVYEQGEKFFLASEVLGQFRKLFPGSTHYQEARKREIYDGYRIVSSYACDQTKTELLVALCRDYLVDFPEDISDLQRMEDRMTIGNILLHLYQNLLYKDCMIIRFYLRRFHYTSGYESLIAAWQRMSLMASMLEEVIAFNEESKGVEKERSELFQLLLTTIDNGASELSISLDQSNFALARSSLEAVLEKDDKKVYSFLQKLCHFVEHSLENILP